MSLLQSADYNLIINLDEPLPTSACQELYIKMPVFLEIREYLIKYHLTSKEDYRDDEEPAVMAPRRNNNKYSLEETLPTHSLRDILSSLLEENRYQEGTRFLTTLGYPNVIQNHQVMDHLLGIFKHTQVIERELRQRSAYLLQNIHRQQTGDYSRLWRIDDERRKVICESQRSVLMYLESTGIQFMRMWFDERFREQPGGIWEYIKELTKGGESVKGLEYQMLENRMALACMLLEQMAMDLAHCMCQKRPWRSMFMRAVSEGLHRDTIERVSRPKALFDFIDYQLGLYMDNSKNQRLLELLFDMVAVTTNCGLVSEDNMLAYLAELYDEDQMKPERFCQFLGLLSSDTLVLGVIDYMLKTGARFVNKNTKLVAARHSITKTVFCIRSVRPMSRREDPEDWWAIVCLLSRLVQRTICAYVGRAWQTNQTRMVPKRMHTRSGALEVDEFVRLSNNSSKSEMKQAVEELQTYLEGKLPHRASDMDDGEREIIEMIHGQIELMLMFLAS